MTAMPSLQGSVGYIFTSCDLDVRSSENVRFKDMVERFRVYDHPRRPEARGEEWLAGELVPNRGACSLPCPSSPAADMRRLPSLWASLPTHGTSRCSIFDTTLADAASLALRDIGPTCTTRNKG